MPPPGRDYHPMQLGDADDADKPNRDSRSTTCVFKIIACFSLCALGAFALIPHARVRSGSGRVEAGADSSTMFRDISIPAETVPVSLGGAIGSHTAGNPLDLQVFMCHLDRNTYFHEPYKYPMFKNAIDQNPTEYLEPTGFVFHMSRCGSTLTANLMGASPYNLVYSESKPPSGLMGLCDSLGCTDEQRAAALRTVVRAMGKTTFHKHLFFKLQSSQTVYLKHYRKAFPNTPWIFVYRDPVPVLMSLLGFKGGVLGSTSASSPCLRTKRNPPKATADVLGMTTGQAKSASSEDYCAAHLATLVKTATESIDAAAEDGGAGGHSVDYDTLPMAIAPIMDKVFKAPLTDEEEFYAKQISGWYAKSRAQVRGFKSDTKAKEDQASPRVVEAAELLMPFYHRLHEASLPREAIPEELGSGFVQTRRGTEIELHDASAATLAISDEEHYATPDHLRGLNRIVDPRAPEWMASSSWNSMPIEPFECPDEPPANYPKGFPAMEVIRHWNPDKTDQVPETHYLSTCRFDYQRELEKAERYRAAEKPFILYNIPSVDATAGRWSDPGYMEEILGRYTTYATEHSVNNHFMYFNHKLAKNAKHGMHKELNLTDWKPPTNSVNLSYRQWLELAKKHGKGDGEHWYFRVGDANNKVILDEMEIFQKPKGGAGSIFLVEPRGQRGIHCRFGMPGVIAEAHFDGSRNMVAMISGVRRWIMAHPNQCQSMYLLPAAHPSGRHSDVDWSDPDLEKFPNFPKTLISEILLKAGEVLYVPTHWFHYISNIGINAQCNSRSGVAMDYDGDLSKCGFGSANKQSRGSRLGKRQKERPSRGR